MNGVARPLREPTARQREVLSFVRHFTASRGFPPTMREIGEHFGMSSTNGVNDHLDALERRGLLVRYNYQARSARVTAEGERVLNHVPLDCCPTCGRAR